MDGEHGKGRAVTLHSFLYEGKSLNMSGPTRTYNKISSEVTSGSHILRVLVGTVVAQSRAPLCAASTRILTERSRFPHAEGLTVRPFGTCTKTCNAELLRAPMNSPSSGKGRTQPCPHRTCPREISFLAGTKATGRIP